MVAWITSLDFSILNWMAEHWKNPVMDFLMPLVTLFGEAGIFWIAVAVVCLCFRKTRRTGFMLGISFILGLLCGNLFLKPVVARVRPYEINAAVELLVKPLSDFSFPSGHTLVCFEACSVLLLRRSKWGIPALILAFLVAFSRLYLYVHYPSDVLAGMLLGSLFGLIAYLLVNRWGDAVADWFRRKSAQAKKKEQ